MLMWQDGNGSAAARGGNFCDVSLSGSGDLYITGTIYAKCGLVTITGNGSGSGCDLLAADQNCAGVQIISDKWDVGGAGVLNMPYDPNAFYHLNLKGLVR
jgi:hypothetical protein